MFFAGTPFYGERLVDQGGTRVDSGFTPSQIFNVSAFFAGGVIGTAAQTTPRVFWSGGRQIAGKAAMEYAKKTGSITLEMTLTGRILEKVGKYLPIKVRNWLWDQSSKSFAKGAEGSVQVFQNAKEIFLNSTWRRIEYPVLKERGLKIFFKVINQ